MIFFESNLISLMILAPLVLGILCFFLQGNAARVLGAVASIFVLLCALHIFHYFVPNGKEIQFAQNIVLVPQFGINYSVGISSLNLFFILIVAVLFPFLFLFYRHEKGGFFGSFALMQAAFLAVLCANDLIFFYAGWEMMLLPILLFVGAYGTQDGREKAARDMIYYAIFGSMIMLCAIMYVGYAHFRDFGYFSFAVADLARVDFGSAESILFFSFMFAFVIKVPLFPFHGWLCKAYVKAPTPATIVLSAVASKVAIFAILHFVLRFFPSSFVSFSPIFVILGLISMIYFGIAAISSKDFKELLAYASASHLGFIIAGIFALSVEALGGALYQSVSHAVASALMFMLVGVIYDRLKSREIAKLGGIASRAPFLAFIFGVALMSSVGLPSTMGFVGEFLIIYGLFTEKFIYGLVAVSSIVVGAVYMFIVYRRAILQDSINGILPKYKSIKSNSKNDSKCAKNALFADLGAFQILLLLLPVVAIFVLGIYTDGLFSKIEPGILNFFDSFIMANLGGAQ